MAVVFVFDMSHFNHPELPDVPRLKHEPAGASWFRYDRLIAWPVPIVFHSHPRNRTSLLSCELLFLYRSNHGCNHAEIKWPCPEETEIREQNPGRGTLGVLSVYNRLPTQLEKGADTQVNDTV